MSFISYFDICLVNYKIATYNITYQISFTKYMYYHIFLASLLIIITSRLQQVVIIFRHGARYHLNAEYDGGQTIKMWGKLTSVGMRQHYNLGRLLRDEYIQKLKFLSSNYNYTQFEVYSTVVNRAIESAISQLYGFYPMGTGPQLPTNLNEYLKIPPYKYYNSDNNDTFAVPFGHTIIPIRTGQVMKQCRDSARLYTQNIIEEHHNIQEMSIRYRPILQKLRRVFNLRTPVDIVNMSDIYDTIVIDKFLNRKLPAQITQQDYRNLDHLHYYNFLFMLSKNVAKAITTPKIQKILTSFDNRITNPEIPLKWTSLSGHDSDIYSFMNILNISSSSCIEELYRFNKTSALNCREGAQFASSIIFELHLDQLNNYYVMIKYNGKYVYLCQQKYLTCGYNQWKERIKLSEIDYNTICRNMNQ